MKTAPGRSGASRSRTTFAVAGIGTGAAPLETLTEVLRAIRRSEDVTVIVASPPAPGLERPLADLVRRVTPLTVTVAKEGMAIEPEHVYLPTRGRWLTIADGALHLVPPPQDDKGPIDHLFESLALEYGNRAAGVLLSETATDGASGLRAIQQRGGLAVAQHPACAPWATAPTDAPAPRHADSLLAPEDIASALVEFALQCAAIELEHDAARDAELAADQMKVPLDRILGLLAARGFDQILHLRTPVVRRRVERAARLRKQASVADYARSLKRDVEELDALGRELLTTPGRFFRDLPAWDALRDTVIAPLVSERAGSSGSIRVWVPGCSTGEEAYSIAMLLVEEMRAQGQSLEVRIFASDIADHALGCGRGGLFDDSRLAGLSSDRRERFFERSHDGYLVDRTLRDIIVFARHDLLRDPPFSRLDLVICRNLLNRLQPLLRQHVIRLLHYSLIEGGALFLGRAEGVGRQRQDRLFETSDAQARIFRRIGAIRRDPDSLPMARDRGEPARGPASQLAKRRPAQLLRQAVVDRFGPPSVLVDRQGRILYLQGDTERFLAQPSGEPTVDLLSTVHAALREAVRLALRRATEESRAITVVAPRVAATRVPAAVEVTVTPLAADDEDRLFAVSFEAKIGSARSVAGVGARSVDFEEELQRARDELHAVVDRLEDSNERLRLSRDDVETMNEELQLAHAELELSRPQMLSLNEQLAAVNRQLLEKVDALESASNDLVNLLDSADIATVFLDRECRVRLFTPAMHGLIELRRRDLGRPITDFARKFDDDALVDDAETVLVTLTALDAVVRSYDDRWFLRRIVPYRTERGRVDGVVVSFTDITARRAAEESLRRINEQLENRVERRTMLVTLLQDVAVIANSAMPMADAFEATLDRVCRDVSWIGGHVYLNRLGTAEDLGVWHVRPPRDAEQMRELLGGRSFEAGEWLVGRVIAGGGACWSRDLETDGRFRERGSSLGVRSVLVFPILVGERVVGALEFFSGAINEPGPRLLEVMRNIGTQLGRVIEREEARERMIDLAIEEQRLLGEELHETLSQQINGLTMLAQSLAQRPPAPGEDERLRAMVDGLQDAHRHVRLLSRGLVPVRVDADGLEGALGEMAREWEQLYGTACVFEHEGVTADIDDERIATAFYRIAREAARNAVLHGGARRIVIRLVTTDGHFELQVRDDGHGMDEVPLEGPGMGLQIMRHRAELVGGTLEIESAPGRGTAVCCRIAVTREGGAEENHEA